MVRMVVNFHGDKIFMDIIRFLSMIIYKAIYARYLFLSH